MALLHVSVVSALVCAGDECSLPGQAIEYPHQSQGPADGGVAAQRLPAEEEVQVDFLAGYQRREDDEHRGACIVRELEEHDLGCNAGGRQVGQRTGPWRAASTGHVCADWALSLC